MYFMVVIILSIGSGWFVFSSYFGNQQEAIIERLSSFDVKLAKLEKKMATVQTSQDPVPSEAPNNNNFEINLARLEMQMATLQTTLQTGQDRPLSDASDSNNNILVYTEELKLLKQNVTDLKTYLQTMEKIVIPDTRGFQNNLESLKKHSHPPDVHKNQIEELKKEIETATSQKSQEFEELKKKMEKTSEDLRRTNEDLRRSISSSSRECKADAAETAKKIEAINTKYIIVYEWYILGGAVVFAVIVLLQLCCIGAMANAVDK